MSIPQGAHCILLSQEDAIQLAKFLSLFIDIDRRLQSKIDYVQIKTWSQEDEK